MREILFRGKLKKTGEWAFGNLNVTITGINIITPDDTPIGKYGMIIPETVGQYTGLTDKNGKKIFEGDIVKCCRGEDIVKGCVIYDERIAAYCVSIIKNECLLFIDWFIAKQTDGRVWIESIGNIYDDPELLEGGKE